MDLTIAVAISGIIVTATGIYVGYALGRRSELGLASWMSEVRAWSSQVIGTLSRAEYLIKHDGYDNENERMGNITELHSLVETGRLYFPNQKRNEYGLHKFPASRGYRHPVLDSIVAAIKVLSDNNYPDRAKYLKLLRKKFISLMDEVLSPALFNQKIAETIRALYDRNSNLTEDLMTKNKTPDGSERLLEKMAVIIEEGEWER